MNKLIELYATFFKMGAITFGGGYAMLPILQRELVENKRWTTEEELVDYFAVAQCTPGVIAVNTATFIGFKLKGISGATAATLGVITPSVIIILSVATFIQSFAHLQIVQSIFAGVRLAVAALVTSALLKLWKSGVKDIFGVIIFAISLTAALVMGLSPVYVVVAAIVVGIAREVYISKANKT